MFTWNARSRMQPGQRASYVRPLAGSERAGTDVHCDTSGRAMHVPMTARCPGEWVRRGASRLRSVGVVVAVVVLGGAVCGCAAAAALRADARLHDAIIPGTVHDDFCLYSEPSGCVVDCPFGNDNALCPNSHWYPVVFLGELLPAERSICRGFGERVNVLQFLKAAQYAELARPYSQYCLARGGTSYVPSNPFLGLSWSGFTWTYGTNACKISRGRVTVSGSGYVPGLPPGAVVEGEIQAWTLGSAGQIVGHGTPAAIPNQPGRYRWQVVMRGPFLGTPFSCEFEGIDPNNPDTSFPQ